MGTLTTKVISITHRKKTKPYNYDLYLIIDTELKLFDIYYDELLNSVSVLTNGKRLSNISSHNRYHKVIATTDSDYHFKLPEFPKYFKSLYKISNLRYKNIKVITDSEDIPVIENNEILMDINKDDLKLLNFDKYTFTKEDMIHAFTAGFKRHIVLLHESTIDSEFKDWLNDYLIYKFY